MTKSVRVLSYDDTANTQKALKLNELFNKKRLDWGEEKDYGVNQGKADKPTLSKTLFMVPISLVISCLLIVLIAMGVPSLKSGLTSVWRATFPEEELRPVAAEALFVDVKADSKYFDSLAYLKKNGIISGFSDNSFRPYQELKRAELIKTIVNAKKFYPLALNYNSCFTDVGNEWYAPAVCFAKDKEWINGYADGSFHPMETLTRAESLKIILEAFEIDVSGGSEDQTVTFADMYRDAWYLPYVQTALNVKFLDENPNLDLYMPDEPALRGDTFHVIYRVLQSQL